MQKLPYPHVVLKLVALSVIVFVLCAAQSKCSNQNTPPPSAPQGAPNPPAGSAQETAQRPNDQASQSSAAKPPVTKPGVESSLPASLGDPDVDIGDPEITVVAIRRMVDEAKAKAQQGQVVMNAPDLSNTRWSVHVVINNAGQPFGRLEIAQAVPQPDRGGFVTANYITSGGTIAEMTGIYNGKYLLLGHTGPNGYIVIKAALFSERPSELKGTLTTVVTSGDKDNVRYTMSAYRE